MIGGSNRLLTAAETAEFLAVSKKTLYNYWRTWGLTAFRVGRGLKFRQRDVESWLERHAA
jgi:excisionase family DNA binding protein